MHLPCFDNDTHTRPHEDHPTRVFVVVNKVQKDHGLDEHVRYDLTEMNINPDQFETEHFPTKDTYRSTEGNGDE